MLAVLAVLACGAGVALVALRALLAVLARLTVGAVLAVGTLDLAEVLSVTVVVGHNELAGIVYLSLHDVPRLVLIIHRRDIDGDLNGVSALVWVGDGDLALLPIANGVGVLRGLPCERGALRQLVGIGDHRLGVGKLGALLDGNFLGGLRIELVRVLFFLELDTEADLDRVVVRGTERVAVAVNRVLTVAEEVLRVVVVARVLECSRLVTVDVPDRGVLYQLRGRSVRKDVIEGTELTVELVGSLVKVLLGLHNAKTSLLEGIDCVLLGVGVEITCKEGRELSPLFLLAEVLQQRFGLFCADTSVVALSVAGVVVALGNRTLRLEVVDHSDEVLVLVVADGVKLLGERLACGAGESRVVEDDGLAHRLHLCRLVDESNADDILFGAQLLGRLYEVPLARLLFVKCVNEALECFIAPRLIAGQAVSILNLGQAEDIRVKLVDRRDDLCLLVFESVLVKRSPGATITASVDCDGLVIFVGIRSGLSATEIFTRGAEVVQHIEEADGVVPSDAVDVVVRVCA